MDVLTIESKVKLGCNMCDKCCVYRGDIKVTPVNVCEISKYLNISNEEFIEKYTERLEKRPPELVLKTRGNQKECILYDKNIQGCSIHKVKPMQCTMFPLVPENLKRDYFYDSGQCKTENSCEITVNEWLNGNNNNYKKHKKSCIRWVDFLETIQPLISDFKREEIDELYNILFFGYESKIFGIEHQMYKKMNIVLEKFKQKNTTS